MNMKLFENIDNNLRCLLCPNYCILKENQYGLCKTRKRNGDKIINPYSGIISSSGLDPIEKKPLYHFMPGSSIFSVGFYGCTLKCQFCQNYSISQYHPDENEEKFEPDEMFELLNQKKLNAIAFTYSEPTLYFEWVLELSILCKKNNIKTVLVTNGYLNEEPAKELFKYIDAVNIDLKSFREEFYKKICSGKLEPVKNFIKIAYENKIHMELTTLVITNTNDSEEEMNDIIDFISSISRDIPFHISRYHPEYNFSQPATSINKIDNYIRLARKKLNFVYGGNMSGNSDTLCKNCNELLVKRNYYESNIKSLDEKGNCSKCGTFNNIII